MTLCYSKIFSTVDPCKSTVAADVKWTTKANKFVLRCVGKTTQSSRCQGHEILARLRRRWMDINKCRSFERMFRAVNMLSQYQTHGMCVVMIRRCLALLLIWNSDEQQTSASTNSCWILTVGTSLDGQEIIGYICVGSIVTWLKCFVFTDLLAVAITNSAHFYATIVRGLKRNSGTFCSGWMSQNSASRQLKGRRIFLKSFTAS